MLLIKKLTNAGFVFLTKTLCVLLQAGCFNKIISYLKNLFNKNKKEKCLDAISLRLPSL